VTLVAYEQVEALVRIVDHVAAFGGIPWSWCSIDRGPSQ
jgi:hypothetical protein